MGFVPPSSHHSQRICPAFKAPAAPGPAPRFHYAWVIAAVTFVVLLVTAGIRATPGVLMVPLEAEFGWSRAAISAAVAINIALFGLIGPFAASAMNRWGLRRLVLAALALLAVSVALTTRMQNQWQMTLLWGVLRRHRHRRHVDGAGRGGGDALVRGAARRSCSARSRRRTPPGSWSSCRCWRAWSSARDGAPATLIVAAAAVVVFVRRADLHARPAARISGCCRTASTPDARRRPPAALAPLAALRMAVRSPAFWVLAGTFFVCGASTNGLIGTHLIAACHDYGIPQVRSAQLLALMGIFDIVGTTASGWLTDRYSSRHLLFGYYTLRGLSLLFLPFTLQNGAGGLGMFAVFYGLDWIATVPPTVRLTSEAFGRENTGVVYGWIGASHQLGASMAAFGAGAIRTVVGDYRAGVLDRRRAVRAGGHVVSDDRPAFIHAGPHG